MFFEQKQAITKDIVSDPIHLQKEDIPVSVAFKAVTINQNNEMILQVKNFYVEKAEVACITNIILLTTIHCDKKKLIYLQALMEDRRNSSSRC